ncbi:MAG: helix-turn-helix domain-containing protein [Bacteroidetes bacterium]|nr:helix-turn-helix domain-containing protein [Bacteroidota bacterium]
MNEKSTIEKPVSAPFVCKMIGVSRPALHKWSKAGIVRSHKIGGKLFYFESEVMEDLKKC